MQPALGGVPLAEAGLDLADGVGLPLVGGGQSVQNFGSALGEIRQRVFERLQLLFRLLPPL